MKTKEIDMDNVAKGNRSTIRQNIEKVAEFYYINIDKIVIREGFNVRQSYGDIESLANSILENGQSVAGIVDSLEDGTFVMVEGHRRYRAMLLLKEWGHEPLFKAIVNSYKTTEEERILQMFTTQDQKSLTPNEASELIKRLINLGHTQASVARKIGKTDGYVSQMLDFSRESQDVKKHVEEGHISVSAVAKIKKEIRNPKERSEAIQKAVDQGGKITAEKITNTKVRKSEQLADEILILQLNTNGEMDKEMIVELINKYF